MNSSYNSFYDRSYNDGSDQQSQPQASMTDMASETMSSRQNEKNQQFENMQNMAMLGYGTPQPTNSVNNFTFNPSLGMLSQNMNQQFPKSSNDNASLSLDTQYANMMAFNNANSNNNNTNNNFGSVLDMDLNSPYMQNSASLNMTLDMDNNMMSHNSMQNMSDMFQNQFQSPIMTSPMTNQFGQFNYPQHQVQGSMTLQDQNSNFSAPSSSQRKTNTTSKASSKSTTAGISNVPWSEPAEGWPSTMEGAKSHSMIPQYRDVYAPSGFDLMKTLVGVVTRPSPEINLGAVDLSCAFVVCDAKSHDVPILYCSESFERLTGYSRYEIIGQNCRFLQSPDGKVEAGIKRKYCDDTTVLFLKNSIARQKESQISLINYRKGGQPFMNLLTMIPIRDENGEVFQFIGFQVDLVENPHAVNSRNPDGSYSVNYQRHEGLPPYLQQTPEQALTADYNHTVSRDEITTVLSAISSANESDISSRMLDKVLLENSDDVIHVLSLKGLFLYLSPSCQRVLEYAPAELVGTALSSVCHPSDIVPVTRELKETQGGVSVSVVFRIRRKTSGYAWFECHGSLHTEQGKGRKCIIMVGRERPVYTLPKARIMSSGGIGDHEIWSKMSTSGMFLYVSNHVKGLLDRPQDDLIGTSIQSLMRPDTRKEFNRVLQIALRGEIVQIKHDLMNRRGMVHQAHTWLYPGDATTGQKPTFLIAQTRLLKATKRSNRNPLKLEHSPNVSTLGGSSDIGFDSSVVETTSMSRHDSTSEEMNYKSTAGGLVSSTGANAMPMGKQDESLASEDNAFDELKTTRSSSWQFELRQLEKRNRSLAEEVQALLVAKKKRKRRRGAGILQKDCANCHTTNTPEWRRGPSGNRDLCNSCGLRWAKRQGRVSPRTSPKSKKDNRSGSPHLSMSNSSSKTSAKASPSPLSVREISEVVDNTHNHNATVSGSKTTGLNISTNVRDNNASVSIPEKRSSPGGPNADQGPGKVARTDSSSTNQTLNSITERIDSVSNRSNRN